MPPYDCVDQVGVSIKLVLEGVVNITLEGQQWQGGHVVDQYDDNLMMECDKDFNDC